MKHIVFGLCATVLIISILMTSVTIEGAAMREREMKNALHAALEEAMHSVLVKEEYSLDDDELLIADVTALLLEQLNVEDNRLKLTVNVAGVDAKKGLLSMNVKEEFSYPNGQTGTIEDEATIILEREIPKQVYSVVFLLPEETADALLIPQEIRRYGIEERQKCKVPNTPSVLTEREQSIVSWTDAETNASFTPEQLRETEVVRDMTFVAVVK